ncbi:efflux RND transporter permease subunit [Salaquimonas pukyongi]|uniref:efflux RND transporter permease subunit n=1 Tax=Salaquimonas pukyongi TaxID=2712698 RepID=UPI00096BAF0D|nr:MMPL family transporter [Salaquimonas pukyongi]
MWRIGFGLEKIGLAAQRRPVLFSLLVLALIAIAGLNVRHVNFNGSILSVLPDRSQAFRDYDEIKQSYRNFSRDVTILIESDRLLTAEGLDDLRNLQLDVSLADGVSQANSIFSVPDFDPQTGEFREWFPEELGSDEDALALLDQLIEKYPQAASLFNKERGVAVITASLVTGVQEDDEKSFAAYVTLKEAAEAAAPEDFKLSFTGLTPIGAAILEALLDDQVKLTVFGLLIGAGIAFYVFRSLLAAVLCAVPPMLTALWTFGLFALFGVEINYLTTVLPTLALILAFADGIFLYYRWQALNAVQSDAEDNLTEAIVRVGPASSLTSITTALAFLSFSYADSEALKEFAYLGSGAVLLAFVAVIIGLPLAIHWAIKLGLAHTGMRQTPAFHGIGKRTRPVTIGHPWVLALLGVVLMICFGVLQRDVTAEYRLTEYLPKSSEVRYGEVLANDITGGRALMLLSVPFAEEGGFASVENRERLEAVGAIAGEQFGEASIFSAAQALRSARSDAARERITEVVQEAVNEGRTDFIANDGMAALVGVRLSSDLPVAKLIELTDELRERLSQLAYGDDILVSGFPVLMSIEFTKLIDQLRLSLILAIILGVTILGLATRSPMMFLAAITPNLLPIFFVLTVLYFLGGTINLSEVVALTVAFGIAIDNAVHLMNVFESQRQEGKEVRHALAASLEEVGPALMAGTVIICAAITVTLISSLPIVPVIGRLMIATLIVALLSNLLILPANILTLEGFRQRIFRN